MDLYLVTDDTDVPTPAVEQYKLALESIVRWVDRSEQPDDMRLEFIRYVAWTALHD